MKEIRVNLTDEQYDEVKEITANTGINLSEFFRELLGKQSGIKLTIDFADIDEYVEEVEKLANQVSGICATIYRTNKAYEQDVFEILRLVRAIDEKSNDIWRYVVDTRTNLYNDARKKLYTKVSENSYKRRRKKAYSEKDKPK